MQPEFEGSMMETYRPSPLNGSIIIRNRRERARLPPAFNTTLWHRVAYQKSQPEIVSRASHSLLLNFLRLCPSRQNCDPAHGKVRVRDITFRREMWSDKPLHPVGRYSHMQLYRDGELRLHRS